MNMKTKFYSLFFSMLLCFTVIETKANAIRIAHCKLSDGTVRVFVEHDQGDLSNASLSNYGLTFITNYGFGSNTVNKTPSGIMNNKGVNALSSCGSSISVTACTNSNTYEDWVYFDFSPGSCNNSLSITVHLNVNTVLAENCSSLFPTTFTIGYPDNTSPVITCKADITVANITDRCDSTLKIISPSVTDNCSQLILGNSLNFDGVNDFALVQATSEINTSEQSQRTVEVYFRVNDKSISSRKQVIWEEGGEANGLNIYVYNGLLYYGIYSESKSWNGVWLSTDKIKSGQWHNAVLVYNGNISSKRLSAYLDGEIVASQDASSALGSILDDHPRANAVGALYQNGKFHTGDDFSTQAHFFGGDIDEIRLWKTARTDSALKSTNTVKLKGNETDLVVYYDFDQGIACGQNLNEDTLYDRTATKLHADLSSFILDSACKSNWTNGSPALNSPLTLTNSYTGTSDASGTYPVGTTNVVWTAKDESNNVSTCVQKITVLDKQAPTILCSGSKSFNITSGLCGYKVPNTNLDPVSFGDNCSGSTIFNNLNNQSSLYNELIPTGTNIVIWTVKDASNNTTKCSDTIIVTDNEAPVISGIVNLTLGNIENRCDTTLKMVSPEVTDNCSKLIFGNALNFDGSNDIALVNSSSSLNQSENSQRTVEVYFRVNDKTIRSRKQIIWEEGGLVNGLNIYVFDGKLYYGIYSESNNWNGTWLSTSAVNSGQWHNAVLVYDGTQTTGRLKAYLDGNLIGSANASSNLGAELAVHVGANAVGAMQQNGKFHSGDESISLGHYFGGDIDEIRLWNVVRTETELQSTNTKKLAGNETGLVVYYDFDQGTACGNNLQEDTLYDRTSTGLDAPLPGFAMNNGCTSNWTNGSPALNSPLRLTNSFTGTSDASGTYPVGTTTITWTATDEYNNSTSSTQTVTVLDKQNPTITCNSDQERVMDQGVCTYTVKGNEFDPISFSDNCSGYVLTNNFNDSSTLSGEVLQSGTNTIVWTITDASNNTTQCSFDITIIDTETPVFTCNSDITLFTDSGSCSVDFIIDRPAFSENCNAVVSFTIDEDTKYKDSIINRLPAQDKKSYSSTQSAKSAKKKSVASAGFKKNQKLTYTFELGETVITWIVTDNQDNADTCIQKVTLIDTIYPVLIVPADINANVDSGKCSASGIAIGTPVTSDNCGILSISNDAPPTFNVGTTNIIWMVKDIYGNISSDTQLVVVTDNEKPLITCAANQSQTADAGVCKAAVTVTAPTTSDNCGVASVTNDYTNTSDASGTYPVGSTTVTWTVTDIHNNSSTCTQVITVTDNEKPKALCSDVNVILSGGIATISETDINNASTDNCGIANMSLSRYSFNCNDIGYQKVTLSITDVHSNTNACEANVKVIGTIPSLTIVQSNLPSFCQGEYTTLTANSNETVNYNWSNNDTSANIKIYTRGNYTVQVKNIFGCTTSASSYVNFDTTKILSAYTIIVGEELELENNSSVQSGGVGALGKKGSIELKDKSTITNAGTFAKANDIDVKSGSSISAKYEGTPLSLALPKFAYNPYCDSKCESKHHHKCESSCSKNEHYHCKSNCSSTHKHCSNQKCNKQSNLKIKKGSNVVITDSIFQNIQIETGATVTFKSKNIYADELKTQKNVTIKFEGCTRIYLCKYLEIDEENQFNTENNSVIVYAEKKVGIKEGATIYANIYTLEKLETKGDCRKRNKLTGMFIAEELKSEYTDFNKNSVCGSCGTLGKKEIASNTEGVRQSSEDFISVYPNPTKNSASININANYRGTITMNVLSATGEVISTYINNEFNGLELMEINLSNLAVGMYFIDINYGLTHKVYKIQKQL